MHYTIKEINPVSIGGSCKNKRGCDPRSIMEKAPTIKVAGRLEADG
jgi:hypothetical protein